MNISKTSLSNRVKESLLPQIAFNSTIKNEQEINAIARKLKAEKFISD